MMEQLISLYEAHVSAAILISICVSIIVAILGVIPSFFVTGANILFFGFWAGTVISFVGESMGAIIAFYLYRQGFRKISRKQLDKHPNSKRLIEIEGKDAAYLIVSLRLLPFIPSGLVTFSCAIGKVSLFLFAIASTIGKLPALLFEAYSVHQLIRLEWQGKVLLTMASVYIVYRVWKKWKVNVAD